ncbi:hypothetical protein GCM10007304_17680 [Rhodococcoides trifolii]|uniref:SGNH hydrolase-type esterase domain-containing protein n=1 Tax=Rhodococcoides trifolii TaxID=908250 RepID=A0A917FV41_9NOCA|nr:SGNH/GDSL hydrolase family protein [Rhodococcus trifolii]GGG04014.1 hypothetical protein GCM10007304_17680 [Rhodococcus trifolii]
MPTPPGVSRTQVNKTVVANSQVSSKLASLHRLMKLKVRDTNILVTSDSTGDGLNRWVRRLATRYAEQYPTWTIIYAPWDDATKTYPVGNRVTVQTGSGSTIRTLIIWNAAVTGQVIAYCLSNMGSITSPILAINGNGPDLIVFNYGHNSPQLADNYRPVAMEPINAYANTFDKAMIVVCTQNPRDQTLWASGSAGTTYADDQGKQQVNYEVAAANGFLCVDVNAAYLDYGNYADLHNSDGLHPNDAGSILWCDLMWAALKPGRVIAQTAQAVNATRDTRLWVPATQFVKGDGSPELVQVDGVPAWALDPASLESVVAVIDWKSHWRVMNIWLQFITATTVGGDVRWQGQHKYLGTRNGVTQSAGNALSAWSTTGGPSTLSVQGTAGIPSVKQLWTRTQLSGMPVALKIARLGADAADTLATDVLLTGIQIDGLW